MQRRNAARRERATTDTTSVVTQVLAVDRHSCGWLVIQTDRPLDGAPVIWAGARLLYHTSRAPVRRCLLVRRPSRVDMIETTDVVVAYLPRDVHMGDLLQLPARAPYSSRADPPS